MRLVLFVIVWVVPLCAFAQVPDTSYKGKSRSKRLSLSKYPKPEAPPEKKSFVVIASDKKTPVAGDPWENQWNEYIEEQSRLIGQKVLEHDGDSIRVRYKVMIDFAVDEEGVVHNLKITSSPSHSFIVNECTRMVMNAPKKKIDSKAGKYARMRITQPIDIIVK
jgi:hypothetical protein